MGFRGPQSAEPDGPSIVRYEDNGAVRYQLVDGTPLPVEVERMVSSIWAEVEQTEGAAALGIAGNILAAESLDAVAALAGDATSLDQLVGHVLTVRDVKWSRGDYVGGFGVFAIADAYDETDKVKRIVTTGAVNPCALLFKASRAAWLPVTVEVRSNRTRAGFNALWLVPAGSAF